MWPGRVKVQMEDEYLPLGKVKSDLLEKFLNLFPVSDPDVIIGPRIGVDAAVVNFDGRCLVFASDPVTFATQEIGWYALNINANDIAVMGAKPRWFLATILLPENQTTEESVEKIFRQLHRAGKELGIAIIGGHTEITNGIKHPIIVGGMAGEVDIDRIVTSSGARIDDDVFLIKGIAIEGTSIIAREKEEELLLAGFSREFVARCQNFLHSPGIGILREALLIHETVKVNCMHDPTESGLAGGLRELALASGTGLSLWREKIPIYPESKILCQHFGLDPLGVIASGSLICTLPPSQTLLLSQNLEERGIEFSIIGKVVNKEEGLKFIDVEYAPLPIFPQDEITHLSY